MTDASAHWLEVARNALFPAGQAFISRQVRGALLRYLDSAGTVGQLLQRVPANFAEPLCDLAPRIPEAEAELLQL